MHPSRSVFSYHVHIHVHVQIQVNENKEQLLIADRHVNVRIVTRYE